MAVREDLSNSMTYQTDKGTKIMEGLLLDQYSNSPYVKAYYACFVAECDLLFEQVDRVFWGRFLNYAVGEQLDILGRILDQGREVVLPELYFGFQGASPIAGFADSATPTVGGIFKDSSQGTVAVTPLNDSEYRRLLWARSLFISSDYSDIETAYQVFATVLGRVPSTFSLTTNSGVVDLALSALEVTSREEQLVLYVANIFMPTGVGFTITRT